MTSVKISNEKLSLDDVRRWVSDPASGGLNIFIGDVRNHALNKAVTHLIFEAYEPMAIKEMQKIADQAIEQWPCRNVAIWHRKGRLEISETAVIIAVSADHRAAAFDAARYCIDTLKETVPIWKKEYFTDGSHWVSAYP
jgi:molybdopterin synthase catalytic subunit